MKRVFVALLLCIYLATGVFSVMLPARASEEPLPPAEQTADAAPTEEIPETESPVTESPITAEPTETNKAADATQINETDPAPETPALVWLSYSDYLMQEAQRDLADPARNVGREALFYLERWESYGFSADPTDPAAAENWVNRAVFTGEDGRSVRVVITDHVLTTDGYLWYKVEAAEGYTLPDYIAQTPYVCHLEPFDDPPSLLIQPQKAIFLGDTVEFLKQAVAATASVSLPAADVPAFFEVTPAGTGWYDLGDISGWHADLPAEYHYVTASSVYLIAPEVTLAYEALQNAGSAAEFEAIWESLPESIRNQFTPQHQSGLEQKQESLIPVEYTTDIDYNGTPLRISVSGQIPTDGVALHAAPVSFQQLKAEGFAIEDPAAIVTALDIKILRDDLTEWQPAEGQFVELTIDMAALGCPDNTVVRLHHKHDGEINIQEVFVVMDGKLTITTAGFSMYVVDEVLDTTGTQITNGSTVSIAIGDSPVFYFNTTTSSGGNNGGWPGMGGGNNNTNWKGTWIVDDPEGAIHYTVHGNETNSESIGNGQVKAQWLKVVALKETASPINITFSTGSSTESFELKIGLPKADAGKYELYVRDDVNLSGCLVAALADQNGKDVSDKLAGAAFTWTRDDGLFIVPAAYERDYQAVNIARDHGGLVEARKKKDANGNVIGYEPVTYELNVRLSTGEDLPPVKYTVYYQSEIINAGFEFPDSKYQDYSFFPNGYPELYWKTTAPGTGTNKITKDIEYGDVTDLNANSQGATNYGVWKAADHATGGTQFAELNAEFVGALYQDIITAPHELIEWEFAHAKRPNQPSWAPNVRNKMYLVIGATENAQKLTNAQLKTLVREARAASGDNADFLNCRAPQAITFSVDGAQYYVWYHDADNQTDYSANANYGWAKLEGSYDVPDKQYRTRVFFVSDPDTDTSSETAGNVIDTSIAGQYKSYLIEYYEQTYKDGVLVVERIDGKEESGEALVYSSVKLLNYDYFLTTEYDYLYKILINGQNYPYDIRYSGKASLYIEKYNGTATDQLPNGDRDYSEYDIVMQVILRDTVIAVQKELKFPAKLTEEQKLTIMNNLNANGGYQATFTLDSPDEGYTYEQTKSAVVTSRDPKGNYKGFVALGDNPELGHNYQIEEVGLTEIPGLELVNVTIGVTRYSLGQSLNDDLNFASYDETKLDSNVPLVCNPFRLEGTIKIADVNVVNEYKEKMTTIYYKAVGNGKVALTRDDNFEDTPKEELAFYSDKSRGADIHLGNGASFAGWYKDPECTQKVTDIDGAYDPVTHNFKPNANIINADVVTFYAKFTTGSIVINRTDAEPGQSFVYHVSGTANDKPVDFYTTIVCGADGTGSREIFEVLSGDYTITEVDSWSWRYPTNASQTVKHTSGQSSVTFGGAQDDPYWLSGLAEIARNVFEGVKKS